MSGTPWRLDAAHSTATLQAPRLTATLDATRPDVGLHAIVFDDRIATQCNLFCLRVPQERVGPLTDCYVRGDDLIATYAETPAWPVRMQIYWRSLADSANAGAAGVECIVSVQTSLLDSRPLVYVESLLGHAELWRLADEGQGRFEPLVASSDINNACVIARLPNSDKSCLQLFSSADVEVSVQQVEGGRVALSASLFRRPLEKGVILRSRLRGWFVPQADDFATALAYHRQFAASETPLTV